MMPQNEVETMTSLVNDIARTSKISADQAKLALGAMLSFLGGRLPSPIMGRIQEAMREDGKPVSDEPARN